MQNLNLNKRNVFICLLGICVLGGLIYTFYSRDKQDYQPEYDKDARIVKNNSDFYTMTNCVNKFINYVNNENSKAVISLLTDRYKKENKINEDNVFSKLGIEKNTIFVAKKMLFKFVEDTKYKYYIYGVQGKDNATFDTLFNENDAKDAYYIIYAIESENGENVFSIEPYDGKEFKNGEA